MAFDSFSEIIQKYPQYGIMDTDSKVSGGNDNIIDIDLDSDDGTERDDDDDTVDLSSENFIAVAVKSSIKKKKNYSIKLCDNYNYPKVATAIQEPGTSSKSQVLVRVEDRKQGAVSTSTFSKYLSGAVVENVNNGSS
eukprot:gene14347-30539_t